MNTKKIVTFLLWVMLPMIGVGIILHAIGGASIQTASDERAAMTSFLFTSGAMLIPLLAVVFTQLIFKEPVLKDMGISFKVNRWWWTGWLLIPVISFAVLGASLLMPGVHWDPNNEMVQHSMQQMPFNIGPWGLIAISMVSGLLTGATLNALFAFGEEIAWRGFLVKEFKGKHFLTVSLIIGVIWGLWHAPIILNGHNYPDHPVAGVFMMVLMCVAMTPILLYFRQKSGSVIVPAIMHGTFNAVAGITAMFVTPLNDLLVGSAGLAGIVVLLIVDVCLYLYDRFVSRERLFSSTI